MYENKQQQKKLQLGTTALLVIVILSENRVLWLVLLVVVLITYCYFVGVCLWVVVALYGCILIGLYARKKIGSKIALFLEFNLVHAQNCIIELSDADTWIADGGSSLSCRSKDW
jgi:hypothetical protein